MTTTTKPLIVSSGRDRNREPRTRERFDAPIKVTTGCPKHQHWDDTCTACNHAMIRTVATGQERELRSLDRLMRTPGGSCS